MVLLILGLLVFALIMWFSPTVRIILLGGFAVALVLSFPVRWLSHIMPRWLAMVVTFLVLSGAVLIAFLILIPILAVHDFFRARLYTEDASTPISTATAQDQET